MSDETPAVLIIEDDPMLRRVLRRVLEDAGWFCQDAHDLATAVERLGSNRFDVLLTDIHVGRRTAHVLTEKLASMNAGIPVVAMSGAASRTDLVRLLRAGVDDFFTISAEGDRRQKAHRSDNPHSVELGSLPAPRPRLAAVERRGSIRRLGCGRTPGNDGQSVGSGSA